MLYIAYPLAVRWSHDYNHTAEAKYTPDFNRYGPQTGILAEKNPLAPSAVNSINVPPRTDMQQIILRLSFVRGAKQSFGVRIEFREKNCRKPFS